MPPTESELLAHIYARSRGLPPPIALGPGDDCALLRLAPGRSGSADLLVTVDQLVEGRHYDLATTPVDLIARKLVARGVSDIAAMAGCPASAVATGALRDGFADANALFDALARWAAAWGCPVAGGDIASVAGPTVLTMTVFGEPHPERGPVLRSGARPGDGVYVTGALGGSFASGRHLTFEPRLREANWLASTLGPSLHAMMDISDGLGRDAGRLAAASSVRIELDASAIPRHPGVRDWRAAASEGEDYELLFAAQGDVPDRCPETGVPITRVGAVGEGAGCLVRDGGALVDVSALGWDHGGSAKR